VTIATRPSRLPMPLAWPSRPQAAATIRIVFWN
jgi:hypothetical protein